MNLKDVLGLSIRQIRIRNYSRGLYRSHTQYRPINACSLMFLTRGGASFRFAEGQYAASKFDFICYRSNDLLETMPVPGQAISYIILQFSVFSRDSETASSDLGLPHHFRIANPHSVWNILKTIHRRFNDGGADRDQACSLLGIQLLRTIDAGIKNGLIPSKPFQPQGRDVEPGIKDAILYINKHFKERLSNRTLANRVSMHPARLIRLFKNAVGLTPRQYVLEKKIEKAREFIVNYRQQPYSVCLDLGFHDYSHFYRVFKQKTGMSPARFAKSQ